MALNKTKLRANINKIYGKNIKSMDDAFKQWHSSLFDYFLDHRINNFKPVSAGKNLADLFNASAKSNTFIQDFSKNLASWVSSITWSNKATAKVTTDLNFQSFSDKHKNDINVEKYKDDLSAYLHNWFSKITTF